MKKRRIFFIVLIISVFLPLLLSGCSFEKLDAEKMRSELDAYITEKTNDGTIEALKEFWVENAEEGKELDFSRLEASNGVIRMGTKTAAPFSYLKNNAWTGLTVELIYNFCLEYGYGLTIEDYSDTNSIVLATKSNKADLGAASISITEERKKSIDYSPTYFTNRQVFIVSKDNESSYSDISDFFNKKIGAITGGVVPDSLKEKITGVDVYEYNNITDMLVALSQKKIDAACFDELIIAVALVNFPDLTISDTVLKDDDFFGVIYPKTVVSTGNIFETVKEAINNTLIKEDRWELILDGVRNTLLITICSIILGSIVGFLVFYLCQNSGRITEWIVNFCIKIVDGLPVVVLLMIVYYLIFGQFSISNILVSIITFILIFASNVIGMLKNAVSAVDYGQFEVSYALGYSEKKTFFKMILPQALALFWMPYKGAVKTQIKATAIVGYIAAVDLTKAGDMIRSSTYEPFLPLVITALLYFILGGLLSTIIDLIRVISSPSPKKSDFYLRKLEKDED